ncbi:hypothetical protein DERP_008099 [Dermatophagoides pteronyssinus]|uniref:Uncharacterized protein n=1 Tax=Dermatophagoides pteronyssinus TaxID=6956 RepID=A0ABQ8JJR0_DERPT|nr:hypothetical protein DERP_008099 [Dermatophagoides pteronyssinus]
MITIEIDKMMLFNMVIIIDNNNDNNNTSITIKLPINIILKFLKFWTIAYFIIMICVRSNL